MDRGGLLSSAAVSTRRWSSPDADEALRLDPKNDQALAIHADLLVRSGDPKNALADLNKSLESNPENVMALGMRAELLVNQDETAKALRDLDKVLEIDPKNVEALSARAATCAGFEAIGAAKPFARVSGRQTADPHQGRDGDDPNAARHPPHDRGASWA